MKITRETLGNVLVIGPEGRLDANSARDLESLVVEAMDGGADRILFDFSLLTYISSSGLRVVLLTARRVQEGTGRMAVCHLNQHVRQVFEMTGLTRILDIESSREVALEKYF